MSEIIFFTPGKKKKKQGSASQAWFFSCYISLYITPIISKQASSTHTYPLFFRSKWKNIFFFFSLKHKQEAVSIRTQKQLLIIIFEVKDWVLLHHGNDSGSAHIHTFFPVPGIKVKNKNNMF